MPLNPIPVTVDGSGPSGAIPVELYGASGGGVGPVGPAGKSAYQVWVEEGHTGTEADFLAWIEGPKGDRGERGFDGPKGDPGDRGLKGDPGEKGDKGDHGDAGAKGDKGDPGDTGPKGDKGDTGERGLKGDTGAKGDTGRPGTPDFFVATPDDLPLDLPDTDIGQLWVTELHGHLHLWRGVNGGLWLDMGQYTGTPGKDGVDGAKGDPGDKGDKGDKGDRGTPGTQGPKGDQGLRGLKGDKGDKGTPGDKGDKGDVGPKGDPGEPGKLIPTGGSAGFVLAKRSQTDHDMEWVANEHRLPIVAEGDLSAEKSEVVLRLNNVVVAVRNLPVNMHTTGIRTVSGEEVVDFRLDTRYDAAGNDNFTLDGSVINTSHQVLDVFAYGASRNPSSFLLRENGRLWQGGIFISGVTQARVTMWAQRIV